MRRILTFLFALALASSAFADAFISEFLANNNGGLTDEDGSTSDWIEIQNNGTTTVNLSGWRLTNDSGDMAKWTFPAVSIAPKGFVVVFASGKNRVNPAANLHTNFKLSAGGGYLALVRADTTVATEFNPYPAQYPDKPYGTVQTVATTTYLAPTAALKYLVPANDTLGTTWTARTFTDTSWTSGTSGVGFESTVPGFALKTVFSNSSIGDLTQAELVLATPSLQASVATVTWPVVNFNDSGAAGNYGSENPPPVLAGGITIASSWRPRRK